jgi:hypothetical protein
MSRKSRRISTCRILVLVAASYAAVGANVSLHAPLSAPPAVAEEGAGSSPAAPTPFPVHDPNDCPFCQSGSGAFTLRPTPVDSFLHPRTAQASHAVDAAVPRTPEWSLEVARAPPHLLFR